MQSVKRVNLGTMLGGTLVIWKTKMDSSHPPKKDFLGFHMHTLIGSSRLHVCTKIIQIPNRTRHHTHKVES